MGELVELRVKRMGSLGCVRLHGGVPSVRRDDLMDRFHDDEACQVFISTDAGGTGLNLQSASVLVNSGYPLEPGGAGPTGRPCPLPGPTEQGPGTPPGSAGFHMKISAGTGPGETSLVRNVMDPDTGENVAGVSRRLAEGLAGTLERTRSAATRGPVVTQRGRRRAR